MKFKFQLYHWDIRLGKIFNLAFGLCTNSNTAQRICIISLKKTSAISNVGKMYIPSDPATSPWGLFPRESCIQRNMCKKIYGNIVYNSKKGSKSICQEI